jgi:hypothetical protein
MRDTDGRVGNAVLAGEGGQGSNFRQNEWAKLKSPSAQLGIAIHGGQDRRSSVRL